MQILLDSSARACCDLTAIRCLLVEANGRFLSREGNCVDLVTPTAPPSEAHQLPPQLPSYTKGLTAIGNRPTNRESNLL